jgi:hypothetical protein
MWNYLLSGAEGMIFFYTVKPAWHSVKRFFAHEPRRCVSGIDIGTDGELHAPFMR